MNDDKQYDAVIIGAGLSGLAAGIRLTHFGQRVCLLEQHDKPGGMNSYYARNGTTVDAGLHAMTNFTPPGTHGGPLTRLLRQLRLKHSDLNLVQQTHSRIRFPQTELVFTNDFADLRDSVAKAFPAQLGGFDKLNEAIEAFDCYALDVPAQTTRPLLARYLDDPLLIDMLLCPLMFYGNPTEGDMDWTQFCILWRGLLREGCCRPHGGMKPVLELLQTRYRDNGGELRFRAPVETILAENGRARGVRLISGETVHAEAVYSCAGAPETLALVDTQITEKPEPGHIAVCELVLFLDVSPEAYGVHDSLVFFSREERFRFAEPDGLVDLASGGLCCPSNFAFPESSTRNDLRFSVLASPERWRQLAADRERYKKAKREIIDSMLACLADLGHDVRKDIVWQDLFTPLTLQRYTGRINGALYGCPQKRRSGRTRLQNLYLLGTDQGYLGITGALLSGITIANLYGLKIGGDDAANA